MITLVELFFYGEPNIGMSKVDIAEEQKSIMFSFK